MHAAAYSDFPECVALLLDRGADVNYASNVRSSPSWRLALRRASRPALTAGCAPRRQNGQVALHFCAYFERNEVMELLLKRGAKTEVPDEVRPAAQPRRRCCARPHAAWPHAAQNDANYPLHMASIANSVECARLLVQYKANKGAKNKVRGPAPAAAAPAVRRLTARCVRGAELRRPDAAGQRQHARDEGGALLEAARSSALLSGALACNSMTGMQLSQERFACLRWRAVCTTVRRSGSPAACASQRQPAIKGPAMLHSRGGAGVCAAVRCGHLSVGFAKAARRQQRRRRVSRSYIKSALMALRSLSCVSKRRCSARMWLSFTNFRSDANAAVGAPAASSTGSTSARS